MKGLLKSIDIYTKIAFTISVILGVISFIVPPTGVIDNSVISFVAELIGGGALLSFLEKLPVYIEKSKSLKVRKGDTEFELESKDNN